jgi:4,5-DOPA dioxygenase extradiol
MEASKMAPAMFISHGAPTFAVEPGKAGRLLTQVGRDLDSLRAVLIMSPHWMTSGIRIQSAAMPSILYDFGGFPESLYQIDYAAPGSPALADTVKNELTKHGINAELDPVRGRDHGAWVPLLHLLPGPFVPVVQISLPRGATAEGVYQLGRALASLRDQGVAIIGSGSLTHNLYELGMGDDEAEQYVLDFQDWIRQRIEAGSNTDLLNAEMLAPDFRRSHPTTEHFMPLLFALGAARSEDNVLVLKGGVVHRVLSMESYLWASEH